MSYGVSPRPRPEEALVSTRESKGRFLHTSERDKIHLFERLQHFRHVSLLYVAGGNSAATRDRQDFLQFRFETLAIRSVVDRPIVQDAALWNVLSGANGFLH